ncbi:hypothetical protein CDV36_000800 [Fusarium kuroshium]|uniref:Uncharacterized protein n=1 Tax=Fusarium kuroshium TaxID=2010991 RepID=A0A3M2SQH3_9HYPO|nr:hypothetical protein CDV36_000800 [Fusarium kuroshium]
MNPCAPAFVPSSQSSESDPDSAKKPTRSPAKKHHPAARDAPELKPKPKHQRNKSSVSSALDPKKYDTMFPSLPSASPPQEQPVQKAKMNKRKKKRAKKVSVHSPENGDPSKPSGESSEGQTAPEPTLQEETVQEAPEKPEPEPEPEPKHEPELLKPTVYTPTKSTLELLKPAIYTPPTSSHTNRRDNQADNLQSPKVRGNRPVGRSSRPRQRPDVPPTPHQDPRNRGRRQPAAGPPITRVGTPVGVYAPAPLDPNLSQGAMMGPFGPEGIPFPPMCGPAPMPFPLVPWNMMPVPWNPYQPQMPFTVEPSLDGQFWPQLPLPLVAAQAPRLQGQPRSGSCESSQRSDSLSTPQATALRARGGHQASNSLGAAQGPGTDIVPRTQVEMFKNQQRAKSSSPRCPRFHLKGRAAWMRGSPLGNTGQIAAPIDKEIPMTTAAKTFDKHLREVTDSRKCTGFIPTRQVQTSLGSPRVMNGPITSSYSDSLLRKKMPRVALPQQIDTAATGPWSQRRVLKPVNSNAQSSSALTGPESGTWSQSKRWTSTATKERQSFQKMMANLRYMGADQSPFVPQSPAELTAFKAAIAETEKLKLAEEVSRRVARAAAKNEEGETKQLLGELMGGKIFSDHLSPVFAMNNCFNKMLPSNLAMQAEWPPLSEFKEEGDKRAGRPGRCLPLPRLNLVAARYISRPWDAYNPDGTIRWDKKVVQVGSHFICAVTQPDASITPPVELKIDALHFLLRAILSEIDRVESKERKEDVKEEKKEEEVSTEQDTRKEQES